MNPILGLLLCIPFLQDTSASPTPFDERFPLELTGDVAGDPDGPSLIESLDWIRLHPYDLNGITLEELLSIPCVTVSGAGAVLAFRENGGNFGSPAELYSIPGGGVLLYGALAPFVRVGRSSASRGTRHLVSLRLRATSTTTQDPLAPGSPAGILSRLVVENGRGVEAGALFSKGSGERPGDALVSGYARLSGLGSVTELIAGDYEIQSAEGLVFWRGPSAVRRTWAQRAREGCALVPHRSAGENRFLRGLAIAYSPVAPLRGIIFISDRAYGAGLDSAGEATGFFQGEYATVSSLPKKDALRENLAGARAEYRVSPLFAGGLTFSMSRFDRSFHPLDRMRLSGDRTEVVGMDLHGGTGLVSYTAEYAVMRGGPRAWSMSIMFTPGGSQIWIVHCRDYQPGFDNPHASGEGDGAGTRNERCVTASLRLMHDGKRRAEILVDAFEHPWPETRTDIPRRGIELTISGETGIGGGNSAAARLTRKLSFGQAVASDAWGRDIRVDAIRDEVRCQCEALCRAGKLFAMSTTVAYAAVSRGGGGALHGSLLGADVSFTPQAAVVLDSRFLLFHTDGYDARLYAYESGIPGLLSVPPLYGHGLRWYLRLRWKPAQWAEIVMRYACTVKDPSVTESEPVHDIPPSSDSQIGIQADLQFP